MSTQSPAPLRVGMIARAALLLGAMLLLWLLMLLLGSTRASATTLDGTDAPTLSHLASDSRPGLPTRHGSGRAAVAGQTVVVPGPLATAATNVTATVLRSEPPTPPTQTPGVERLAATRSLADTDDAVAPLEKTLAPVGRLTARTLEVAKQHAVPERIVATARTVIDTALANSVAGSVTHQLARVVGTASDISPSLEQAGRTPRLVPASVMPPVTAKSGARFGLGVASMAHYDSGADTARSMIVHARAHPASIPRSFSGDVVPPLPLPLPTPTNPRGGAATTSQGAGQDLPTSGVVPASSLAHLYLITTATYRSDGSAAGRPRQPGFSPD